MCEVLMDKVAPLTVETETLLGEGVTPFGFIALIVLHINAQLMGTVGELATVAVGTDTLFSEVLAEGSLDL